MVIADDEIPYPVLLNTWKHHAGALRQRIAACAEESDLTRLAGQLVVIGADLMDLYIGELLASAIAGSVLSVLKKDAQLEFEAYRVWINQGGGYRSIRVDDQSIWILRLGEEAGRYVHIHPGRWSPQTRRVRANVLKTAVIVLAHVRVHGGDSLDVQLINAVRKEWLGLSPVASVAGDEGIGALLAVLQCP